MLVRIPQICIALVLGIFTLTHWSQNHIGQNIINITATLIFIIGLDNIVFFYRWYINKQSIEYEATFIVLSLFVLGNLL